MDLTGSLVDTNLKIYPTKTLTAFLKTIPEENEFPENIMNILGKEVKHAKVAKSNKVQLTIRDFENLSKIKDFVKSKSNTEAENKQTKLVNGVTKTKNSNDNDGIKEKKHIDEPNDIKSNENNKDIDINSEDIMFLTTSDIEWIYNYLQKHRNDPNVPYLHDLLGGVKIELPENEVLKRNPVLEARCVKLRAQQEAREYRKMTKTVDNVRMRYPEDSISYQLKQLNRQLIAIGQFIISIFAGFMFGFRGVELMIGNLDFGFRLLLGVMCALIIALAEIYFLAKKLNEELSIPETVQLGGPPKFAQDNDPNYVQNNESNKLNEKEHQD